MDTNNTAKEFKLPREITKDWLTALRSGEYAQVDGVLAHRDEGIGEKTCYCCLGVLSVVCGIPDDKIMEVTTLERLEEHFSDIADTDFSLTEKFGIPKELLESTLMYDGLSDKLIDLNDNQGKTFPEIADWIEENVELY